MLRGISDDREEDQPHERLGDVHRLDERVDAAHEILGAHGHRNSDDDEDAGCLPRAQLRFLFLAAAAVAAFAGLVLGVEECGVGTQLEDEVEDIEDEQDDGGAAGEEEDVCFGILVGFGKACIDL